MKIKQFVSKHKIALSVLAGTITGSSLGLYARRKIDQQPVFNSVGDTLLYMTPDQVISMMSEGSGHIAYDTPQGQIRVTIMEDQNDQN
ncbi:hypothetical protein SEA_SCHWARTZ33_42 [Gordonia phage Schwartz33]|nr:hypothetical protein SEA_SCHWARTZ33_42 [Gordonia phage Schwartz33]